MHIDNLQFGQITIDDKIYHEDIVIDKGKIIKRDKEASRRQKAAYGHTPLTVQENIPWNCKRLIIGSGIYGRLPVTEKVRKKAKELGVELIAEPTPQAIKHINEPETNFVLHLTC